MTSTSHQSLRGLAVKVPSGFIGLPTQEPAEDDLHSIADSLQEMFGLPEGDESAAEMARWFATAGHVAGAGGMEFAAMGFFRPSDSQDKPVSIMVTAGRLPGNFKDPHEAIAGLQALYGTEDDPCTQRVNLNAGPALLVTTEQATAVPDEDDHENQVLQNEVRAWIPDDTGSTIGVASVSTASRHAWSHVCDLALQIFDSAHWDPTEHLNVTEQAY